MAERAQQTESTRTQTPPPIAGARGAHRFARGTIPPAVPAAQPWRHESAGDGRWRESWPVKLSRRALTVPATLLIASVYIALLPVTCTYGLIADTIRRRPQLIARFHLMMAAILGLHVIGLIALFAIWLGSGRFLGVNHAAFQRWSFGLERWWGNAIIRSGEVLYDFQIIVLGDDCLEPGPVLVFARHTSIIDTMLPLRLIENWHGMVARIVKKHVLLWDPCVDGISQRMPRTFVRRGSNDHEAQLDNVRKLSGGMGENDALWMYPEGTRFTANKRQRILDRLAEKDPEAFARAEQLEYTLPPRPGGTLALLEQCDGMDVVFCAHTGMELANRLDNFLAGSLYKRRARVEFWRVPAAEIPKGREQRILWMHEQWRKVDRWVAQRQDADITEALKHQ